MLMLCEGNRHFLQQGYAVIFVYRSKTLQPFIRHFSARGLLETLHITHDNQVQVSSESCILIDSRDSSLTPRCSLCSAVPVPGQERQRLIALLTSRQRFHEFLHEITFTSLAEYLYILQELTCSVLSPLGSTAMLYLAAAVSDFYIPREEMVSAWQDAAAAVDAHFVVACNATTRSANAQDPVCKRSPQSLAASGTQAAASPRPLLVS